MLRDILLLICFLAVASSLFIRPHRTEPAPISPKPAATAARIAPPFKLPRLDGSGDFAYTEKSPPVFMILSAVGCADCQARIPTDQQARQIARAAGYNSLSVMVFGDQNTGRNFVERTHQAADDIVYDADSAPVTVGTYRGSDGTCWLLLKDGKVVWQGPPDLGLLRKALRV